MNIVDLVPNNYFLIICFQEIDFAENTQSEDMPSDLQQENNGNEQEGEEIIENTQVQAYTQVEPNNEIVKSTVTTPNKPSKKVKREDPRIDETFNMLKSIEAKKARRTEKTESSLYGEYVASQLEKFDPHTRAVVKHKFATILFEAEMGIYGASLPASRRPNPNPQWSNSSTASSTPLPSPNYGRLTEQEKQTSCWDASSPTNPDASPVHFSAPGPVFVAASMTLPSTSTDDSSSGFQYQRLF